MRPDTYRPRRILRQRDSVRLGRVRAAVATVLYDDALGRGGACRAVARTGTHTGAQLAAACLLSCSAALCSALAVFTTAIAGDADSVNCFAGRGGGRRARRAVRLRQGVAGRSGA